MKEHECFQNSIIKRLEDQVSELLEFRGEMKANVKFIREAIEEIKNNHLKHINNKINTLLFTVLAGVFLALLTLMINGFLK